MTSTELIISINQTQEFPSGYSVRHSRELIDLSSQLESLPDWAMQCFDQTGLDEVELPDAVFVPGDEDFPASVIISALELNNPEFRQKFIDKVTEEFQPLLEKLPLLYLIYETPLDDISDF